MRTARSVPNRSHATWPALVVLLLLIALVVPAAGATAPEFDFDGFYAPIRNSAPFYKAPAGSTIPVNFSLGDYYGMEILKPGFPRVGTCGGVNSRPASGELKFTAWNGEYSYLWQTSAAWKRSCRRLVFEFVDGSSATAYVRFHR